MCITAEPAVQICKLLHLNHLGWKTAAESAQKKMCEYAYPWTLTGLAARRLD
jgi:hypothetical protein